VTTGDAEVEGFAFARYAFGLLTLAAGCQLVAGDFTIDDAASCAEGTVQCVGNVLKRCNSELDAMVDAAVCASEALCDAKAGACQTAVCEPGERRCQAAELQLCNGTRDGWLTFETCPTAGHCSTLAGGCTGAPCEPGKLQCNEAVLEYCKDDQSGWGEHSTCASAALCDEVAGKCHDPCTPGEFQCLGEQLQICRPTLDWATSQVCESDALCDASGGTCRQGGCSTPGVFRCSETGILERCPDDLTAWTFFQACESAAHCDAVTGTCMDEPCTTGQYQCNGATLEVCNAERTGRDPVSTTTDLQRRPHRIPQQRLGVRHSRTVQLGDGYLRAAGLYARPDALHRRATRAMQSRPDRLCTGGFALRQRAALQSRDRHLW
jgi:hypothetical protein